MIADSKDEEVVLYFTYLEWNLGKESTEDQTQRRREQDTSPER